MRSIATFIILRLYAKIIFNLPQNLQKCNVVHFFIRMQLALTDKKTNLIETRINSKYLNTHYLMKNKTKATPCSSNVDQIYFRQNNTKKIIDLRVYLFMIEKRVYN